jgi:hypothetical protein
MQARCEHAFAEAKDIHGMGRARSRGLDRMQEQATWTAIVPNLKRLCRFKAKRPRTGSFVCTVPVIGNNPGRPQTSFLRFFVCFFDWFKIIVVRKATFSPDF